MDETAEWCKNFLLEQMPNRKDPAKLHEALIRPVYLGPTVNDIFSKLTNAKHMSLIEVNSGHHYLGLDKQSV